MTQIAQMGEGAESMVDVAELVTMATDSAETLDMDGEGNTIAADYARHRAKLFRSLAVALTALTDQLAKANEARYMPGVGRCPKCGFVLHERTLFTATGQVGAKPGPVGGPCLNGCGAMWRVTWAEALEEAHEIGAAACVREREAQKLLALYREKRSVDGMNGRMWDARRHLEAEEAIAALESATDEHGPARTE